MSTEEINESLNEGLVEVPMIEAEWISNRGMSVLGDVELFEVETFHRLKAKGMIREVGGKEAKTRGSKSIANKD
jgi:hypothetical protein